MNSHARSRLEMMNWGLDEEEPSAQNVFDGWANIDLDTNLNAETRQINTDVDIAFDPLTLNKRDETHIVSPPINNTVGYFKNMFDKKKLFNKHSDSLPKIDPIFIDQDGAKSINLDGFSHYTCDEITITGVTSDTEFILTKPVTIRSINIVSTTGYPQNVYELLSRKELFPNLVNINITASIESNNIPNVSIESDSTTIVDDYDPSDYLEFHGLDALNSLVH